MVRLPDSSDPHAALATEEGVLDSLQEPLARFVARLARDPAEADDLRAEVNLRLLKRLRAGETLENPRAYAFRAAWNLRAERRRGPKGATRQLEEEGKLLGGIDETPARDAHDWIEAAVRFIGSEQRALLHLRYVEDLSYAEIADSLGVPEGTVKSRLHTARAALKESLERLGGRFHPLMLALWRRGSGAGGGKAAVGGLFFGVLALLFDGALRWLIPALLVTSGLVVGGLLIASGGSEPAPERDRVAVDDRGAQSATASGKEPITTEAFRAPTPEAITGRVVCEDEPLAGIAVSLRSVKGGAELLTRTDASGRFRFAPSEDRVVARLEVVSEGHAPWPGRLVRAGDEVVIRLQRGWSLSGRVLDREGLPVAGARLHWYQRTPRGERVSRRAVSAADGRYRLRGLRPVLHGLQSGSSTLVIRKPGFGANFVSAPLEESAERDQRRDFYLAPGQVVEGRVVSDAEGKPIGDALVIAWERSPWMAWPEHSWERIPEPDACFELGRTRTDVSGRFRLEDLPAWSLERAGVDPEALVRADLHLGALTRENGFGRTAIVDAGPGERTRVEIRVAPSAVVTGRLLDAAGEPLGGAILRAHDHGAEPRILPWHWSHRIPEDLRAPWRAVTDEAGVFRFAALPRCGPGFDDFLFEAWLPDEQLSLGYVARRMSAPPGSEVRVRDIRLPRPLLQVRVTDASGDPLSDALVRTGPPVPQHLEVARRTDGEGRCLLPPRGEGDDALWIHAAKPGWQRSMVSVPRKREASEEIVIRLTPATELVGVLRDEGGAPLDGMRLSLFRAGPEGASVIEDWADREESTGDVVLVAQTHSDHDGQFRLEGLGADSWLLQVTGYRLERPHLQDVPAGTSRLDLVVSTVRREPSPARIRLSLQDRATGQPVFRAGVGSLQSVQEAKWPDADAVTPGGWSLPARFLGSRVRIVAPGYVTREIELPQAVPDDGLVVRLAAGARVSGQLRLPAEARLHVAAQLVFELPESGQRTRVRVGDDGRFEARGLRRGRRYRIVLFNGRNDWHQGPVFVPAGDSLMAIPESDDPGDCLLELVAAEEVPVGVAHGPAATAWPYRVQVRDAAGRLLASRTIRSANETDDVVLAPGRYRVEAVSRGKRCGGHQISFEPGEELDGIEVSIESPR